MAGWQIAAAGVCAAPGVLVGLLLVVRRQAVVGGLLIALGALPLLLLTPDPASSSRDGSLHGVDFVAAVASAAGWIWFYIPPALLAAYFPSGRLPSPRWRWLIAGWLAFLASFHLAVAVDPESYGTGSDKIPGSPPAVWPPWLVEALGLGSLLLLLALLIASVACVVVRYRRGPAKIRRQIKWFALSALLLPLVLLSTWVAYFLTDVAGDVVVAGLLLVYLSIPATVLIAILRHDLYDIDRLVSSAVAYIVLSGLLTSLFAVVTVGLGVVVGQGSDAVAALATLACAVAFGPARRRIQRAVDGRFDRDHRDALAQVGAFVDAVRDGSAEPEQIDSTLAAALRDPGLHIAYWMASDAEQPWRDGDGRPIERPLGTFLDVAVRGRLLASVGFDAAGRRPHLLREVLREAHLPLELARSRIELRQALAEAEASRARLVQAGDEERRRLERDIHDGAQQQLVAIGMSLKLAQARLDPHDGAHSAIGNAVADLQGALAELRRIASGVRPRGLDEGLATALRHLIRSSPLPVDLRVTSEALPSAVSTTAYYVAAEGLANALKHARPTTLTVDISRSNGVLHVVVTDDGSGGAVVRLGSGLAGLRDRVLADGGELVVESPPGEGTIVRARLPCES